MISWALDSIGVPGLLEEAQQPLLNGAKKVHGSFPPRTGRAKQQYWPNVGFFRAVVPANLYGVPCEAIGVDVISLCICLRTTRKD